MTETNLCPLGQRSGNALLIRELQLCCPAIVAPSAPQWCAAPPLLNNGLGIHDSQPPRTYLPLISSFMNYDRPPLFCGRWQQHFNALWNSIRQLLETNQHSKGFARMMWMISDGVEESDVNSVKLR